MGDLTQALFAVLLQFGGPGLVLIGIFDSSFLFAPLGNDLLVTAMVARRHSILEMLYYAAMSTIGSVLGCLLVDVLFRKAGEKGLDKHLPRKRLEYVKNRVHRNAPWALILASLAPPPFPFTPFVMAAAALDYPRSRMLAIISGARMLRFTAIGILALLFGRQILKWSENPLVRGFLFALIVVCVAGSVVSVYGWIRRSRKSA